MIEMNWDVWFQEFSEKRGINEVISGQFLYKYHISLKEFEALKLIFQRMCSCNYLELSFSARREMGAALLMLGSDFYRRAYNRDWKWEALWSYLDVEIADSAIRSELVIHGLAYWDLPKIEVQKGKNRDFLGTIFKQGGLPLVLVSNPEDHFSKVIHFCFKNYNSIVRNNGSLFFEIKRYAETYHFPDYHSDRNTILLIEDLILTIINIKLQFPEVAVAPDPLKLLETISPDWYKDFPLPIDENNASSLLFNWFRDAGSQVQEYEESLMSEDDHFITTFNWSEDVPFNAALNDGLFTSLSFPLHWKINLNDLLNFPSTLRLELVIYEGQVKIISGIILYAEINDVAELIITNRNKQKYKVKRRDLTENLSITIMNNGIVIYEKQLVGTSLSVPLLPLFFIEEHEDYICISDFGSFQTDSNIGYLLLPLGYKVNEELSGEIETICTERGSAWLKIFDHISVYPQDSIEDTFFYNVGTINVDNKICFDGKLSKYTGSRTVYEGFPTIKHLERGLIEYINNHEIKEVDRSGIIGNVNYKVKDHKGSTVLVRRFSVIPKHLTFTTNVLDISSDHPSLIVKSEIESSYSDSQIIFSIHNVPFTAVLCSETDQFSEVKFLNKADIPREICLDIPSTHHYEPMVLKIPLQFSGIALLQNGYYVSPDTIFNNFCLKQLFGIEILVRDLQKIGLVKINFKIPIMTNDKYVSITRVIRTNTQSLKINLSSFIPELEEMFSVISYLPDSKIGVSIQNNRLGNLDLTIQDFNSVIEMDRGNKTFKVIGRGAENIDIDQFFVISFKNNVTIEKLSVQEESIGNRNFFSIGANLPESCIIFSKSADTSLHPYFLVNEEWKNFEKLKANLNIVNWRILQELLISCAENEVPYSCTPLQALVEDLELLVLAFFRLGLSYDQCMMMRSQLGILWEEITIEQWLCGWRTYYEYMKGLIGDTPEANIFIAQYLHKFNDVLSAIIPTKNLFTSLAHGLKIDMNVGKNSLLEIQSAKAGLIYNRHEEKWNTTFQIEFEYWLNAITDKISSVFIDSIIKNMPSYQLSTLVLPMYMASVVLGINKINDLLILSNDSDSTEMKRIEFRLFLFEIIKEDHQWYETCFYHSILEFLKYGKVKIN